MDSKSPESNKSDRPMTSPPRTEQSWDFGAMLWGSLFIAGGGLLFLKAFNIVDLEYASLWRLWPILIIATGLSIIAIRSRAVALVAGTLVAIMLAVVTLSLTGIVGPTNQSTVVQSETIALKNETIKNLSVSLKSGASEIMIKSDQSVPAVEAKLASTFARLHASSNHNGLTQSVQFVTQGDSLWWKGEYKNDFTVTLTEAIPVDLSLDTGAVAVRGDMSNVYLRSLRIDSGVSDINFKLGIKEPSTNVRFNVGVSTIKFALPKSSGISLRLDDGLSGKNINGLKEISKNYYETANYSSATHKINIDGEMGMAELTIDYY